MEGFNKYKEIVGKYCFADYKWVNNLDKLISKPFSKYVRIDDKINKKIEIINIDASYNNTKIVTVTIYYYFNLDIKNFLLDINGSFNYTYNYKNFILLKYLEEEEQKNKVSKFVLKLTENDNILTIMNSKYDLLNINNLLESENRFKHFSVTVYELLKNIILLPTINNT